MGLIVGIDLGTTYSAVAKLDETGRAVIVHNTDGDNITPSVVSVRGSGNLIVGEEARKELEEPNTIGRFKREMGTDTVYPTAHGEFSPTELSALVLKKLKSETEKSTNHTITEAVITIPANFSNEARQATLSAARTSGLTVRHIINEPTAAALYYAFTKGEDLGGNYAVFDLGGGTFDVTIMRVNGQDIEVLASEGVSKLGGDDFDSKLIDLVKRKYLAAKGGGAGAVEFGKNDAEELKKSLSRQESASARVYGDGGRANVEVTRAEFEEAISTFISQMEMLCESVIEDSQTSKDQITAVILAGGSTRIPAVQQAVQRAFGKEPVTFGNPDEVVALGAAIYAAYRTDQSNLNAIQKTSISKVKVSEITNKYFGTISVGFNQSRNTEELQNSILIEKGTKLPARKTETFYTMHDNQQSIHCTLTEANSPETDQRFVRMIWEGDLGPLPADRAAGKPVEITFAYDTNQVIHCEFKDVESGQTKTIDLQMNDDGGPSGLDIEKFTVE